MFCRILALITNNLGWFCPEAELRSPAAASLRHVRLYFETTQRREDAPFRAGSDHKRADYAVPTRREHADPSLMRKLLTQTQPEHTAAVRRENATLPCAKYADYVQAGKRRLHSAGLNHTGTAGTFLQSITIPADKPRPKRKTCRYRTTCAGTRHPERIPTSARPKYADYVPAGTRRLHSVGLNHTGTAGTTHQSITIPADKLRHKRKTLPISRGLGEPQPFIPRVKSSNSERSKLLSQSSCFLADLGCLPLGGALLSSSKKVPHPRRTTSRR